MNTNYFYTALMSLHHLPPFENVSNNKDYSLPQNIKVELESVQEELSTTRKDKFMLQAKVGELRNSMKTVLLQNQQLKQDLKQSRLRKVCFPCDRLFCPVTVSLLVSKLSSHVFAETTKYLWYLYLLLFNEPVLTYNLDSGVKLLFNWLRLQESCQKVSLFSITCHQTVLTKILTEVIGKSVSIFFHFHMESSELAVSFFVVFVFYTTGKYPLISMSNAPHPHFKKI